MEHKQSQSTQPGNGFLFGLIVGVLITLFLVTKKGRKLLKKLGDEGLDIFEEIESLLAQAEGTVVNEVKKQKDDIVQKTEEIKQLVAHTVEEKTPEIKENVQEMKDAAIAVVDAIPVDELKEKIEEVKQATQSAIQSIPTEVEKVMNEVQESPAVQKAEAVMEKSIEQIVKEMETAQSQLQTAKEELQEAIHIEKPKSPVKRFFKGIRKKI